MGYTSAGPADLYEAVLLRLDDEQWATVESAERLSAIASGGSTGDAIVDEWEREAQSAGWDEGVIDGQ